ncbi:CDPK-related kinase 5 [Bienertia sinuspersici]
MTKAIAIEDVRREVKILKGLAGDCNLIKIYDAYEDDDNVYFVMELCGGGKLLDRILSRGGKYTKMMPRCCTSRSQARDNCSITLFNQLHSNFCLLLNLNFLFTSKDEDSSLKAIDFGLSDFVKPGSAYYVAPEVLHRSYTTEADVWSVGVIAYILLCGSRPFWARTESGIFRAVLKADPSFTEPLWPSLSSEARDFVKRMLNKDPRKRITAAQALYLSAFIFPSQRNFEALSKTLTIDELFYLKEHFALLQPSKNGTISLENIKEALLKNATDVMKESRAHEILTSLTALQYRRMDFEEFCAAILSAYQLEALERWDQHARCANELFEKD